MMVATEDWDRLYYAIIKIKANKAIDVIGIGSTKLICRNSAMDYHMSRYSRIGEGFIRMLELLDVNARRQWVEGTEYAMVYAEAKVYIYGKRYGFEGMNVVFDPTYREDLIRFAGYNRDLKWRRKYDRRRSK